METFPVSVGQFGKSIWSLTAKPQVETEDPRRDAARSVIWLTKKSALIVDEGWN